MSEERDIGKEIYELACILYKKCDLLWHDCVYLANNAVKQGYHKQIEAEWGGINGDTCSNCGTSLGDIMDADSDYRPSFRIESLIACPYCGARMRKGE